MRSLIQLVLATFLASASFPSGTLLAQDTTRVTLQGTVLDAVRGVPLPAVEVSMSDLGLQVLTDSAGAFTLLEVPLGVHQLAISLEGYEGMAGRLLVEQGGEMVLRMNPLGGLRASDLSRIQGRVRDLEDGRLLEGAAVKFAGLTPRATDSEGRFEFPDVPPGQYEMTVDLLGYSTRVESVVVTGGKNLTLDVTLSVEPIQLDPIEVVAEARNLDLELSGFYQRRDATSGYFITQEKIEERAPLYTTDLFRGIAGVKVVGGLGMGTQNAVVLTGSRAVSFSGGGGPCYPAVWLNGQMVHQGSAGPTGSGPAFLDSLIQPGQIAGIEVYNSPASMPVQYNLFAACGVIVLWTRQGR